MHKIICLLPLFFSFSLFAQYGPTNPLSVRSNGVGNASVAFTDINSIFNNQAGLANVEDMGVLFSAEQTYLNTEFENFGVGFAIPIASGTLGLSFHYFGIKEFHQIKYGLTYARKLTDRISLGIQFDMVSAQILVNGNLVDGRSNLFTGEVGLQAEVLENLLIGIHLYNPVKLEIIEGEFLPTVIRTGATYTASKKILFHIEAEKDFDCPFVFKGGVEYELVKDFWIRMGVHTNPTAVSLGVGYQFKNGFRIDLASNYQEELGFTPSVGLGFDFF